MIKKLLLKYSAIVLLTSNCCALEDSLDNHVASASGQMSSHKSPSILPLSQIEGGPILQFPVLQEEDSSRQVSVSEAPQASEAITLAEAEINEESPAPSVESANDLPLVAPEEKEKTSSAQVFIEKADQNVMKPVRDATHDIRHDVKETVQTTMKDIRDKTRSERRKVKKKFKKLFK